MESNERDRDRPQTILVDVMGTLVYDPFYREVPEFFGVSLRELLALKDPHAWQEFESGDLTEPAFAARFFADGRDWDMEGLKRCMAASYAWLPGMEQLLSELRAAGYALHALSNYAPWYRMIEAELGLGRYLEWSFVSCDMGVRKPDAEAYLHPARTLGVAPNDCLFIDDRSENVRGAEQQGMPAVLFESSESLRAELRERYRYRV